MGTGKSESRLRHDTSVLSTGTANHDRAQKFLAITVSVVTVFLKRESYVTAKVILMASRVEQVF